MKQLLVIIALAFSTLLFAPSASAAPEDYPVVFIHGWNAWNVDLGECYHCPTVALFEERGFVAYAPEMPDNGNTTYLDQHAQIIKDFIDSLGVAKVHLVGHSMGGMSTRYCIKVIPGCAEKVATYTSLDTLQYGSKSLCHFPVGWGRELCASGPIVTAMNAGDDTPGDIFYTQLLGEDAKGDSAKLIDGGACYGVAVGDHVQMPFNPVVIDRVVQSLRGVCP